MGGGGNKKPKSGGNKKAKVHFDENHLCFFKSQVRKSL